MSESDVHLAALAQLFADDASQIELLSQGLTLSNGQRDDALARVAFLEANWEPKATPPPPPPPPPGGKLNLKFVLGISGSSNMVGAGDREFSNTGGLEAFARRSKADCPRVDRSWKPKLGTKITKPMAAVAVKPLQPDDLAGVWHESDVDYRTDGDMAALKDKQRMKEEFYDAIVALRTAGDIPNIWVPNIVSSYSLSSPALLKVVDQFDVRADIYGVDIDGGKFPKDYGDATLLAACRKHADDFYHGNLTFPEWGWKDDPENGRLATITAQLTNIVKVQPLMVIFHDNPNFGKVLNAAERAEFAKLVKQYNG